MEFFLAFVIPPPGGGGPALKAVIEVELYGLRIKCGKIQQLIGNCGVSLIAAVSCLLTQQMKF
jgi:hypothetical protein